MNYWVECVNEALDEAGVSGLTDDQIKIMADCVQGGHENYGLATGEDVADNNISHEDTVKLKMLQEAIEREDAWAAETVPCRSCFATGVVKGVVGIPVDCDRCGGRGRVRK